MTADKNINDISKGTDMDISKISAAIEQIGYNAGNLRGITRDEDIQRFAQENGISVSQAKSILQEAEQKAQEIEQISQQNAILDVISQQDDEEEIFIVNDADFDNFLNQQSPEQQMQNIFNQNV